MATRIIAGAMSGTSADGVDVAVLEIDGGGLGMTASLLGRHHESYVPELRQRITAIRLQGGADFQSLAACARAISLTYASAVFGAMESAGLKPAALAAIAAHGQTLYHRPPFTIQWLDPALLAAETGVRVVSDFRRADCAAGGQGAPLVPFADYILFRDKAVDRAVVNIGGIANVTLLPAAAALDQVRAYDTGPGNCISDYLMQTHFPGGAAFDNNGAMALRGNISAPVVEAMGQDPYFQKAPPKSTDGPEMIHAFNNAVAAAGASPGLEDLLATACYITAAEIHKSLSYFGETFSGEVFVSGGGTRNQRLMNELRAMVSNIRATDEFGVPSESREAIAFALLGAASLDGVPANVRSATGATRSVVLGSVTPRP
jgi:anhydro-N-acetylmuramic acid kinase